MYRLVKNSFKRGGVVIIRNPLWRDNIEIIKLKCI